LSLSKILFIPDTHVPYHNKKAFKLVLKAAKTFKPDTLVILGDFCDFYSVSRFSKDPKRKLNLKWEIEEVNKALNSLDALSATKKIFIAGNHEYRLEKFIFDKAPELDGLLSIESCFKLKERGWVYVPYRKDIKLGKIYLTHDINHTGRMSGHKVIDTYMHSAITAHTHRMIYIVEADGVGEPVLSAQWGWLGDVEKIDYQHRITAVNNYVLGFGIGYLEKSTGYVFCSPVPIIHNRCMINGEVFSV